MYEKGSPSQKSSFKIDIGNFHFPRAITIASDAEILGKNMVSCELNLCKSTGFSSSSYMSTSTDISILLPDNDNKFSSILSNTIAMS